MTRLYILYGIIVGHMAPVISQTATDDKNLHTKLFILDDYQKRIRPVVNQSRAIKVFLNYHLKAIIGVDEVNEVMKTTGLLWVHWFDDFLQWEPMDYGGLLKTTFTQDEVWKPDISLMNSYNVFKELGSKTLKVSVESNGFVHWYPFQVYESTCSIDIRNFPFDVQSCSLQFVSWNYNIAEVNLTGYDDQGLLLNEYEPNSAWDVSDWGWSVRINGYSTEISFWLTMKRRPQFFLISVILPIALLSLLNIFVFVLPCESGERSGFAITVFLSLAVFLTIVSATLPANSETIALFAIYLIIQTVQSTLIALVAVLMIRIHSLSEDTPIPSCIAAILRAKDILGCKKRRRNNKITDSGEGNSTTDDTSAVVSISTTPQSGQAIYHDCQHHNEGQPKYTWKHVLNLLDAVCFIFFTSVLFISTTVCFTFSTMGGM